MAPAGDDEDTLAMLPPALRMAASKTGNSSFQLRKQQTEALAKIRGQPREDLASEQQKRLSVLQKRKEQKERRKTEDQQRQAQRKSAVIMETSGFDVDGGHSWQRRTEEDDEDLGSKALRTKVRVLREKLAKLKIQHSEITEETDEGHSYDKLEKKLEKVGKLLSSETPGSKEHAKLTKKKKRYEADLEDLVFKQMEVEKINSNIKDVQQEIQLLEEMAVKAEAKEAKEEKDRAKAEKKAAKAKEKKEKRTSASEDKATNEKERLKKERLEQYHKKMAERKQEEEAAKAKQERQAELEKVKKKLKKVEGLISEAEESGKDTKKLLKKKASYLKSLEEFEEWREEQKAERQKEEARLERRRLRKEREASEKAREDAIEAESKRKAAEEAEKRQKEKEEREEAAERRRQEAEERRRKAEQEAEQRRKEQEEARLEEEREERERQERKAEAKRQKEEEILRKQREEEEMRLEKERAAREAKEAEEQAARLQEARQLEIESLEREIENMAAVRIQALVRSALARVRLITLIDELTNDLCNSRAVEPEAAKEVEKAENEREMGDGGEIPLEEGGGKAPLDGSSSVAENLPASVATEASPASKPEPVMPAAPAPPRAAASQDFLDLKNIPEPHSENTKKILSELEAVANRTERLEKTLKQNGISVSEDIPYEIAKEKITEIQEEMKALAMSTEDPFVVQKKYYVLEEQLSKYVTAMMLTDEFAEEQRRAEEEWENSIEMDNIIALRKIRSHMPVNIRNMTEDELTNNPSPNGKKLPKVYARKFKRTNVLQLLRVNPEDLERMHPSLIEGLRSTGLTLTERRALHEHLKDIGSIWESLQQDPSIGRKYSWFMGLKAKFKEMVTAYDKCVKAWGPPGEHRYLKRNDPGAGGCPLIGNQCPIKADSAMSYEEDYGFTQEAEYEKSETAKTSPGETSEPSSNVKKAARSKRISMGAKARDEELMIVIRTRLNLAEEESSVDLRLIRELFHAEKRVISLEKQLAQNGIALPKEEIPFTLAKAKVTEITEEIKVIATKMGIVTDMKEMAILEKEYSKLSDELEKYNNALMLTKEYALELIEKERQWEESVRVVNEEALRQLRRHMPVNIKDLSEQDMIQGFTPNGKQLPPKMVRKFKRTNILQLVRLPPSSIEPMHPSSLESMRSTGLTLTERRALHEHLKELGAKWKAAANDKMAERKWMWHESLRGKFKELVEKYNKHVEQYGPPGNHDCPLIGKQCPLVADKDIDYTGDYGFPSDAIYNVEKVEKSHLLTVEELEKRKNDDEWGGPPVEEEPEPAPTPTVGLMSSISDRRANGSEASPVPRPKMGGGLLGAIAAKGGKASGDSKGPKPPGGLLAAIQAKGANASDESKPPKMGGGLLAAIQSKGGNPGGDTPRPPKMGGGLLAAIQSKGGNPGGDTPKPPQMGGGLLAAIQARGKS